MLEPILGINERETGHLTVIYLQAPLARTTNQRTKKPITDKHTSTSCIGMFQNWGTPKTYLEMMYLSRVKTKTGFMLSMSCLMSMLFMTHLQIIRYTRSSQINCIKVFAFLN